MQVESSVFLAKHQLIFFSFRCRSGVVVVGLIIKAKNNLTRKIHQFFSDQATPANSGFFKRLNLGVAKSGSNVECLHLTGQIDKTYIL